MHLCLLLLTHWRSTCNRGCQTRRPGGFFEWLEIAWLLAQVDQPFDECKFNFKKALQQEVLFQFDASQPGGLTYSASAPVSPSPNLVFINISPIEYGHVLLVPRVLDGLNQVRVCATHPLCCSGSKGHFLCSFTLYGNGHL